ncbi:MAG: hypothetical protein GQ549_01600 [Gammaproteobacteria bacterium]|nr:hypothetical protein [Gammaproteobacteria bacterium]
MNLKFRLVLAVFFSVLISTYASSCNAEADGPDYWQVRNVERNDTLNMRSSADLSAAKIGEIPHDAQCIRNMGCKGGLTHHEFITLSDYDKQLILKQRPRWCRVRYKGTTAWVAGRYLREGRCNQKDMIAHGMDPQNHSYLVEKEIVVLANGHAREKISGTTAIMITEIIQKPIFADLDGDNTKEAALILMQHTGGSGTFFYLAVARDSDDLVESYFLGDRVKVEAMKIFKNQITVEYLDREKYDPMAVKPMKRTIKKFKLEGNRLVETSEIKVLNQPASYGQ